MADLMFPQILLCVLASYLCFYFVLRSAVIAALLWAVWRKALKDQTIQTCACFLRSGLKRLF